MWGISTAVVVDDALGPPGEGSLHSDDKNAWIDFVSADANAQAALLAKVSAAKVTRARGKVRFRFMAFSPVWFPSVLHLPCQSEKARLCGPAEAFAEESE